MLCRPWSDSPRMTPGDRLESSWEDDARRESDRGQERAPRAGFEPALPSGKRFSRPPRYRASRPGLGPPVYRDLPINPSPPSRVRASNRHLTEGFFTVYAFDRPLKEGMDVTSEPIVRRKTPVLNPALLVAIAAALATLPALAVATMTAVVPANVSGPLRFDSVSA